MQKITLELDTLKGEYNIRMTKVKMMEAEFKRKLLDLEVSDINSRVEQE